MTKEKNWQKCPLTPITQHKGAISLDPAPQKAEDRRAKLIGRTPAHLRGGQR